MASPKWEGKQDRLLREDNPRVKEGNTERGDTHLCWLVAPAGLCSRVEGHYAPQRVLRRLHHLVVQSGHGLDQVLHHDSVDQP